MKRPDREMYDLVAQNDVHSVERPLSAVEHEMLGKQTCTPRRNQKPANIETEFQSVTLNCILLIEIVGIVYKNPYRLYRSLEIYEKS